MILRTILFVTILNYSGSVLALDAAGEFASLALGNSGCGKFIEAVKEKNYSRYGANWNEYRAYAYGYFTAVNYYVDDTINITGNSDSESIMYAIEQHCRENPLDVYLQALLMVVKELHKNRIKGH
jgi:hypothetical protein